MPNTSNDSASVDYLKYFTDQLPHDLARMAALRDELALRQGSIDAVKQTAQLKAQAEQALADAKATAATLTNEAKEAVAKAKEQKRALDEREKALNARASELDTSLSQRETDINRRAAALDDRDAELAGWQKRLADAERKLNEDRATLDARVKAFQAKVAALTA
jgi:chromosome segregation ATPase